MIPKSKVVAVAAFCLLAPAVISEARPLEKSVIMIRSVRQDWDYSVPWEKMQMNQGIGTGFVIEGNRILTNAHNVANFRYLELKKVDYAKRYPARVAFVAHDCDLALLEVPDANFFDDTVPLQIGDIPTVNSTVNTFGFPLGGSDISVTEGVVSRIQLDVYSHSGADAHLVIQTDAAINPGNSGGPVMQDGKVVGVAFQGLRQADNIGYLIPTTVIRHFLDDASDGEYHGFGSMGVILHAGLHSQAYQEYLNIPTGRQGIVVVSTMLNSSAADVLQPDDVITRLDDYDVDNDGKVRIHGLNLHMSEVVEQKQIGDTVDVTFFREGIEQTQKLTVELNRPVLEYALQYETPPEYVTYAGLVFTPVTRNYLETFGLNWLEQMPFYLRYLFHNSMELDKDPQRKQYVVLSAIMTHQINTYAMPYKNAVVESINSQPVYCLADVTQALQNPQDDTHIMKFAGHPKSLVIDVAQAQAANTQIVNYYNIPAQVRLEEK